MPSCPLILPESQKGLDSNKAKNSKSKLISVSRIMELKVHLFTTISIIDSGKSHSLMLKYMDERIGGVI